MSNNQSSSHIKMRLFVEVAGEMLDPKNGAHASKISDMLMTNGKIEEFRKSGELLEAFLLLKNLPSKKQAEVLAATDVVRSLGNGKMAKQVVELIDNLPDEHKVDVLIGRDVIRHLVHRGQRDKIWAILSGIENQNLGRLIDNKQARAFVMEHNQAITKKLLCRLDEFHKTKLLQQEDMQLYLGRDAFLDVLDGLDNSQKIKVLSSTKLDKFLAKTGCAYLNEAFGQQLLNLTISLEKTQQIYLFKNSNIVDVLHLTGHGNAVEALQRVHIASNKGAPKRCIKKTL